jgi:inorganic pyrophosphatase
MLSTPFVARHFRWPDWEAFIQAGAYTLDRPHGSSHPRYPDIIYPIDYGYIDGTLGTDGDEVDVFVGTASSGLVGLLLTTDHRRGDRECKLLYNCTPEEIYLVHGFINFDPALMTGLLVLRRPMRTLWERF